MSDHTDLGGDGRTVRRLIGVYDADGTVRGELTYWVGARLGQAHCSLCDITHGVLRERREWRALRAELPVSFVTFHRDDQPVEVAEAVENVVPIVVAETVEGITRLLGPSELARCAGSPGTLIVEIRRAVQSTGLRWRPLPG